MNDEPLAQTWHRALSAMCDRNAPIEVTLSSNQGDDEKVPVVLASRLLFIEPGRVCIEGPHSPHLSPRLQAGGTVTVLAIDEEHRMTFEGEILEKRPFLIRDDQPVVGVWLTGPDHVRSAQHREHYRVEHSAEDLEPALLIPAPRERDSVAGTIGASRIADSFSAVVCNISGGGIGIEVPPGAGVGLVQAREYRCILRLPTMQMPIELPVDVVHVDRRTGGARYIGLQFNCTGDDPRNRQYLDNVARYTAWYQRRRLQQRRGRAG